MDRALSGDRPNNRRAIESISNGARKIADQSLAAECDSPARRKCWLASPGSPLFPYASAALAKRAAFCNPLDFSATHVNRIAASANLSSLYSSCALERIAPSESAAAKGSPAVVSKSPTRTCHFRNSWARPASGSTANTKRRARTSRNVLTPAAPAGQNSIHVRARFLREPEIAEAGLVDKTESNPKVSVGPPDDSHGAGRIGKRFKRFVR